MDPGGNPPPARELVSDDDDDADDGLSASEEDLVVTRAAIEPPIDHGHWWEAVAEMPVDPRVYTEPMTWPAAPSSAHTFAARIVQFPHQCHFVDDTKGELVAVSLQIKGSKLGPELHLVPPPKKSNVPPFVYIWEVDVALCNYAAYYNGFDGHDEKFGDAVVKFEGRGLAVIGNTASAKSRCWRLVMRDESHARRLAESICLLQCANGKIPAGFSDLHTQLLRLWDRFDEDFSGGLDPDEVSRAMTAMGQRPSQRELTRVMDKFDADRTGVLDFGEFCELATEMLLPLPVKAIADYFCDSVTGRCDVSHLKQFFKDAQGDDLTVPITSARAKLLHGGGDGSFVTREDLASYLMSTKLNSWVRPAHERVFMDMNQPLHHYFVASSHNTCLQGAQSTGSTSLEMLAAILRRGARTIELEVRRYEAQLDSHVSDGFSDFVVHRTHSPVRSVSLRSALAVIEELAFVASEFPLLVFIEAHIEEQHGDHLREVFRQCLGSSLFDTAEATACRTSLSPSLLKRRIILACTDESIAKGIPKKMQAYGSDAANTVPPLPVCGFDTADSRHARVPSVCAIKHRRRDDWGVFASRNDCALHSRDAVVTQAEDEDIAELFRQMGRRQLIRTYPRHVTSKNDDPMDLMRLGVQVISMNWQRNDPSLRVYTSLFAINGNSGYLLKPPFLRTDGALPVNDEYFLVVTIVAGLQIPLPDHPDVYSVARPMATVTLRGTDVGAPMVKASDPVENSNSPDFGGFKCKFRFSGIETSALTINVSHFVCAGEKPLDFAEASVLLSSLRMGYRVVPLMDSKTGETHPSARLLCHFWLTVLKS